LLLSVGLVACCGPCESPSPAQEKNDGRQGTLVEIDGLRSLAPAEWKDEEPANKMRYKQFKLPRVKDDKADAEVVIFQGITGSAKDNIKRWKDMFVPPEGQKLDDVAKVTDIKVGGLDAVLLDVHGTYKFKERPFDPASKEQRQPNSRMLAVHIEGKKGPYHIRFVGPAQTVEHYRKGFEDWLKAFK
jgi:hypothetical protein